MLCPMSASAPLLRVRVVFDFHGDLYGKVLTVCLVEKIREERKFSSVAELRAQLEHDMEYCREKNNQ